MKIVGIVV